MMLMVSGDISGLYYYMNIICYLSAVEVALHIPHWTMFGISKLARLVEKYIPAADFTDQEAVLKR